MRKKKKFARLARNLMIATVAAQLRNKLATEERNHADMADDEIGEYWYDLAERVFHEAVGSVVEKITSPTPPTTVQ